MPGQTEKNYAGNKTIFVVQHIVHCSCRSMTFPQRTTTPEMRRHRSSKSPDLLLYDRVALLTGTSSAVKAARQSWMLAGFVLALNQLLMPPLLSFTSGRLSPRNTSYLDAPAQPYH